MSARVLDARMVPTRSFGFQRDHSAWRLESCVPASFAHVEERPMPTLTDTTLTIRCPHCIVGIEFRPMIAYKDGRFVCRDCAHTVRPGVPEYRCPCRRCVRLSQKNGSNETWKVGIRFTHRAPMDCGLPSAFLRTG